MYFLMFLMYLKLLVHVAFKNFILFNFNLNDFCYLVLDRYRWLIYVLIEVFFYN